MNGWWVSSMLNDPSLGPPALVAWCVVVIGSIVLHELAHGWAALWQGDSTPRDLGHMTWNPLVHMEPWSFVMFAAIGIAWGAMPVDRSRFRGRYGDAYVALAGPAMNIGLALVSFIALVLLVKFSGSVGEPLATNLERLFRFGVMLNLLLAVFNMMPIYSPAVILDGGFIAANLSRKYEDFATSENGGWVMLGAFIMMFWFGFGPIMDILMDFVYWSIGLFI